MKTKTFQETDTDLLDHKVNKFNEEYKVKFTQHSTCFDAKLSRVVTTMVLFYE